MAKKAVHRNKLTLNGKSKTIETNMFQPSGHMDYSGFGYHEDKNRKAARRDRKMEENRARFYGRDDF